MPASANDVVLTLSDIDYLPGASARQKANFKSLHTALHSWYHKSKGLQRESAWQKIVDYSRGLIQVAQAHLKPRIDSLRASVDDCWQVYIDIGIKYFLNIPGPILDSGIEEMLPDFEATLLKVVYEWGPESGLRNFQRARRRLADLDVAIANGKFRKVSKLRFHLDDLIEIMDEDFEEIEACYKDLLAAANSLRARDRVTETEANVAKRTTHFQDWAAVVNDFVGGDTSELPMPMNV